ncbi:MAG: segregation/condensation protein A [Candidatus Firestonebacteria bacterium]
MYNVKLPAFEGPFDLLLHLIKENEVNIYDIPVAKITEEYLKYIQMMEILDLNIAGEFIVMAATLIHIKSKMLLPVEKTQEGEEIDPRAELVRRLLEYQKFKEAASNFSELENKQRDVFYRFIPDEVKDGDEEFVEVTLFDLLKAFQGIIAYLPKEEVLKITREEIKVTQKINEILDKLEITKNINFSELFDKTMNKLHIIATFLAVLELVRLKLIKAYQSKNFADIQIIRTE